MYKKNRGDRRSDAGQKSGRVSYYSRNNGSDLKGFEIEKMKKDSNVFCVLVLYTLLVL